MKVRYYLDPDTGLPHTYSHNISEQEVEQVLDRPLESRRGSGGSTVLTGQTAAGRFLRVIAVIDADRRGVFVITAYDLRGKALRALRRRFRRRGTP